MHHENKVGERRLLVRAVFEPLPRFVRVSGRAVGVVALWRAPVSEWLEKGKSVTLRDEERALTHFGICAAVLGAYRKAPQVARLWFGILAEP